MNVQEVRPGLWRWTAPHPSWTPDKDKPGGWGQRVGCVYYEPRGKRIDSVVLIDPLAPPEGSPEAAKFWEALDRDVARANRPVTILVGNCSHSRSAQAVLDRYWERPGSSILAHESVAGIVTCRLTGTFGARGVLPGGVEARPIEGLDAGETVFHIPEHRALVFADAVIGSGGERVRVAPVSWGAGTPEAATLYRKSFRASLRALLDLEIDCLLVSHGDPILQSGRAALAAALDAPAWGE